MSEIIKTVIRLNKFKAHRALSSKRQTNRNGFDTFRVLALLMNVFLLDSKKSA